METKAPQEHPSKPQRRGLLRLFAGDLLTLGAYRAFHTNAAAGYDTVTGLGRGVRSVFARALVRQRTETFEEAVERLGVSDSQLVAIHNEKALEALMGCLFAAVAASVAAYFWLVESAYAAVTLAVLFVFICLARAAAMSLRAFQIRRRALGGFLEWVHTPSEWLPGFLSAPKDDDTESENQ